MYATPGAPIIDVGGGASTLVNGLLGTQYGTTGPCFTSSRADGTVPATSGRRGTPSVQVGT